jgi:hypothetical protein
MDGGRQAPCWASFPPELIRHIADCILATNDIDYYMDFHAICTDWRHATDDPTNTWDMRFRPSKWIMFRRDDDSTIHIFMNTITGRFLRKDMPLLTKCIQVRTTSSGYLVLTEPHGLCVLNPFTGHLHLVQTSMAFAKMSSCATAVFGSPPTLMLLDADGDLLHRVILGGEYVPEHMDCKQRICPRRLLAQAINGGVYDLMGCPSYADLFRIFSTHQIIMFALGIAFVVESAGEMLMVIKKQHGNI